VGSKSHEGDFSLPRTALDPVGMSKDQDSFSIPHLGTCIVVLAV
jgi:hypothetical protein